MKNKSVKSPFFTFFVVGHFKGFLLLSHIKLLLLVHKFQSAVGYGYWDSAVSIHNAYK